MVERSLSMREVQGSIPCISNFRRPECALSRSTGPQQWLCFELKYAAEVAGMTSAGAGCRLQTCRRGDPQRFNSAFPAVWEKSRDRQGSNLRGQGPLDFRSSPLTTWVRSLRMDPFWGCSSNGRALAQHARGTGIDTLHLHFLCTGSECQTVAP